MTGPFYAALAALFLGIGPAACMLLSVPKETRHSCCPSTPKPPCYDKCPYARMEAPVKTPAPAKAVAAQSATLAANLTAFLDPGLTVRDLLTDGHGLHLRIRVLRI